MTVNYDTLLGLTIQKPGDMRKPVEVVLALQIDGVGDVYVELDEHQFAHFMGSTQITVEAGVNFAPTAAQKAQARSAVDVLIELFDSLSFGHPDRDGIRRSIEVLKHEAAR